MEDRYVIAKKVLLASLDAVRVKKKVSYYTIQRHTGLAFHQVKGVLNGERGLSGETLIAILDAFGVDLTELVKEKLNPKPNKKINAIKE